MAKDWWSTDVELVLSFADVAALDNVFVFVFVFVLMFVFVLS